MKTPKERFDLLVEYTGLKLGAIAKKCGYERPQAFYDVYKGKAKKISEKMASSIIKVFPDIRESWLLTGEGPMLTENTNSPNTPQEPINQNQNDMNIELVKMIDRKDREIGELQATIANLREEIGALRTKLESMTFMESQSQKKGAV